VNGDGKMVDTIDQFVKQCGSSECYSNSGVQKWQESLADKQSTAGDNLLEGSLAGQKHRNITITSHNC